MPHPTIQSIYTDGACSGNPGPGGWGVVICFDNGAIHELGGAAPATTNNRMELQAAIAALTYLIESSPTDPVTVYTDSQYVQNGITKWVKGWKAKGWKTAAGKPVLNQDLWQELDHLATQLKTQARCPLNWQYVKAHAGNVGNERCDAIAQAFAQRSTPRLKTLSGNRPDDEEPDHSSRPHTSQNSHPAHQGDPPQGDAGSPSLPSQPVPSARELPQTYSMNHSHPAPPQAGFASSAALQALIEPLRLADEIASQGYLITTAELAQLTGIGAAELAERGDRWVWRNWQAVRERQEEGEPLWRLQRHEVKKR